jgi:acyl-CoA synthetase (AMP-forming)/AMP-acid ligase II
MTIPSIEWADPENQVSTRVSRRRVLRMGGVLLAGSAAAGLLAACSSPAAPPAAAPAPTTAAAPTPPPPPPAATPITELFESGSARPEVNVDPGDVAVLPYSSGTTGTAKGVMLSHRNLVAAISQGLPLLDAGPDDVGLAVLPFFHIYGMVVTLAGSLHLGATVVSMPRFDLDGFLEAIQRYRASVLYLVPPMVLALAYHPDVEKYDLSSVRIAGSGAAPLGADVQEACAERLHCAVGQGWGMTETTALATVSPFNEPDGIRPGTSGVLIPNTEAKVVDVEDGHELGPDEDGELWVRGPQMMLGYLGRPEETAATLVEDGWLRTGDVGHFGGDGYVAIVDRVKELIKYKGFQVAPAELEALLVTHPAVADAAVVPSPDPESGEVPKAYVVARGELDPDEVMAFVAGKVSAYKKIRRLEVVDEIPRSAAGKILRRQLILRERQAVQGS